MDTPTTIGARQKQEYAVHRAHELGELREHGAMPGRFVKPS